MSLLRGVIFSSLREETASFDEARKKKNSVNFLNYFSGLPRRFAPRNDDSGIHTTIPSGNATDQTIS